MPWVLFSLGIVMLIVATVDLLATVVRPNGSGVIATGASRLVMAVSHRFHDRDGSRRMLSITGVVAVVILPVAWMLMMWVGWALVFNGSANAVLVSSTQAPANFWSRVYFAGYSLFTSGLGDRVPGGAGWQFAAVIAAAMGLALVTLAITFLMPVLQAANDARSLAAQISQLGRSTAEIVDAHRTSRFASLASLTEDFPASITTLMVQHHSYPVLTHFHARGRAHSLMPGLAALHDACIVGIGVADDSDRWRLDAVVGAIHHFADDIGRGESATAPPIPDIDIGPTGDRRFSEAARTRCLLAELVESDGWNWSAVTHGE